MESITIRSKLTLSDYIRATYSVAFSNPWKIGIYVVLAVFAFFNMRIVIYQFIFFGCVVVIPLMILLIAYRNFRSNPLIREEQVFILSDDSIHIKGESFTLDRTWEKIYQVSETNRFVFIWLTKRLAYPLPAALFSKEDKKKLKEIIVLYPTIKNKLKREEPAS